MLLLVHYLLLCLTGLTGAFVVPVETRASSSCLEARLRTGTIMDEFRAKQLANVPSRPFFQAGDTVEVACEIVEGASTRVQKFVGVVIKRSGEGFTKTFSVRKISSGIGVERTFPLYAPFVKDIVVTRRGSVRRAKLYYLRDLTGKSARIKEKTRGLNFILKFEEERKQKIIDDKLALEAKAEAEAAAAAAEAAAAEAENTKEEEETA